MIKRSPLFAAPFLFALVVMLQTGCATPIGTTREKAMVSVKGKIVFIPLRESHYYYYDYEGGTAIANAAVADLLLNSKDLVPVDSAPVRGLVRSTLLAEEVTPDDWALIGRNAGADYIVVGSVDNISWIDPADPITPRCVFTVSFQVIDAASRKVVYSGARSGRYPVMSLGDQGVSVYEMGLDGLKRRAYTHIGQSVGRTFHDYYVRNGEKNAMDNNASGMSP